MEVPGSIPRKDYLMHLEHNAQVRVRKNVKKYITGHRGLESLTQCLLLQEQQR